MSYYLFIPSDDCNGYRTIGFLPSFLNVDRIVVPGVFVLHGRKFHAHRYAFRMFFYDSFAIYSIDHIRSKKKLFDVVQHLLQGELDFDVQ